MKMKMPKPLNSTVGYVLLGVVLAFMINQGMALALSTDMPIVAVESNSMVPTFYRGDILVLRGSLAEELDIGDIIVFSPRIQSNTVAGASGSSPIVHRIVKINPDGSFQTQGDANPGQLYFEKHITPSQIHGKSVLIIPYLGWVKIGITEYVVPNAIWIAIAAGVAYVITLKLSKNIKTPRPTFMRTIFR
jgi:signal peptidase I